MKLELQKIREFSNLELLAKQLVEGFITGLHKSPYHGFSVEFAEHKLYNTGESTKDIDWKVYARTDKLFSKRYEEETNLRCHILLDVSSSMYYPSNNQGKIAFSVMAAGAISFMLQRQRDAVGITTFSDNIEQQTSIKSTKAHMHSIMLMLENILSKHDKKTSKTRIPDVLHQIANTIHKRSLVIIFSDMFDDQEHAQAILNGLHHLKHNNHEVLLFHVNDYNTEVNLNFDDRPYKFIDLETNEEVKLNPSEYKDHYARLAEEYFMELKLKCGQFKIDFINADINQDFDHILSSYLIKRAKMK